MYRRFGAVVVSSWQVHTRVSYHRHNVAPSGTHLQLRYAHAGCSMRRQTADAEVVGVGGLHTFVDAVADTHTVSLERPWCRVPVSYTHLTLPTKRIV